MAIAGAGRSRATESDGGQARMAKGLQLTRANGDCGVDGVDSVGDPEPERTAWLVLVRGDWCGLRDSAPATTTDLAASACDRLLGWLSQGVATALSCLDAARGSRAIFGVARFVGAVMSSAFRADNWIRWP